MADTATNTSLDTSNVASQAYPDNSPASTNTPTVSLKHMETSTHVDTKDVSTNTNVPCQSVGTNTLVETENASVNTESVGKSDFSVNTNIPLRDVVDVAVNTEVSTKNAACNTELLNDKVSSDAATNTDVRS